jgi:hypothetical protein
MPELGTCNSVVLVSTISLLLTALGLTATAGLRAYLPLIVLVLAPFLPNGCGGDLLRLSPAFRDVFGLDTAWLVAVLLAILALVEVVADKIVGVDHISDIVHTVIRPIAGGIVLAGLDSPLSEWNPWAAATVGVALALTVHATKAVVRGHVSLASFGFGNVIISIVEDAAVAGLIVLALLAPFLLLLFGAGLVVAVVLLLRLLRGLWRGIFGRGDRGEPGDGPPPHSMPGPPAGPLYAPPSRPLYGPPSQPLRAPSSRPLYGPPSGQRQPVGPRSGAGASSGRSGADAPSRLRPWRPA